MLSFGAGAQSTTTTWGGPVNTDYNVPDNWTRGVPATNGTAVFGTEPARTTITNVGGGRSIEVDSWQFLAGAPAYTFSTAASGNTTYGFSGAGIVNSSSVAPTINVNSAALYFNSSSSMANAIVNVTNGVLNIFDSATAGTATITLRGAGEANIASGASGGQARFILESNAFLNALGTATTPLTLGSIEGAGTVIYNDRQLVVGGNNLSTTFSGSLSGRGVMIKTGSGTLVLSGVNFNTGGNVLNSGGLVVNGTLSSTTTVNGGTLSGIGTFGGGIVVNGGTLAPGNPIGGNSIGAMTLSGNFVHNRGGIYQVEVNAAGQGDRVSATGTATLNGGAVQVLAQSGSYAPRTIYTIVNATGGLTGTFSSVTSSYAFLSPSLSYDANNAYLTLSTAFANGGQTPNQQAAGGALDQAVSGASGDTATVIGALTILPATLGPSVLDAISPQPYADIGTTNLKAGSLFMNAVGQQMALARGATGGGTRQSLAQACEVAACDDAGPWSVWASGLGGLGSVLGDGNASTLTYAFGGAAAGLDYRVDPRFLVGVGAGYTHGTQWVNSFYGQGWSDSLSVAAYGSFTAAGFYLDALAGYAYTGNQMQRQIMIPGLPGRTANGSAGANQFLGQAEAGYRIGIWAPAQASITPFGRLQVQSVTQNAFGESGASALSLNVAQQTTNSLRSTLGADLAAVIALGGERTFDLGLRLGWLHEYANTARPITAAFAGAPSAAFTVYGATPQRDSAAIGFSAATAIASTAQLYLRYDGEVGGGTDNHALSLGVRLSW
jgi:uncharacterized protein with beta-barrel porin domain